MIRIAVNKPEAMSRIAFAERLASHHLSGLTATLNPAAAACGTKRKRVPMTRIPSAIAPDKL